MNKKIHVIVVTYNGVKWIDKCFASLINSVIPLEIYAIDNASSDETVAVIKTKYPQVHLIETGSNLGFGKANNIGLKIAIQQNADYVFLLNQDAWIENDTIKKLIDVAEVNNDFGIISPLHLLPNTNELEWYFSTYIVPEKCKNLYSDIYRHSCQDIYELPFINAAAWLITKNALQKNGGFDPLFSHYGEDEDYCNRAVAKQVKIGVVPSAKIYHDCERKDWSLVQFNLKRQLIVSFIELKNINFSFKYSVVNFTKTKIDRIFYFIIFRKWKNASFTTKLLFASLGCLKKINLSRKEAKQTLAYLK